MKLRYTAALALSLALSAVAHAESKAEKMIEYRQSAMTVIGANMGTLAAMAKGDMPFNKDIAVRNATVMANLSDLPLIAGAWGPGTDKGASHKSDAKVWSEPEKFKAAYDKFTKAASLLPAAAVDQKSLQVAMGEVGKTCKGCHDDYRAK